MMIANFNLLYLICFEFLNLGLISFQTLIIAARFDMIPELLAPHKGQIIDSYQERAPLDSRSK